MIVRSGGDSDPVMIFPFVVGCGFLKPFGGVKLVLCACFLFREFSEVGSDPVLNFPFVVCCGFCKSLDIFFNDLVFCSRILVTGHFFH